MRSIVNTKNALLGLLGVAFAFLATSAPAQSNADFPNLKGNSQRTGRNGAPNANGSGRTVRRWATPNGLADTTPIVIDNTSFANTSGLPGGPYDANPFGVVNTSAGWTSPALEQEANSPYLLPRRLNALGGLSKDLSPRSPSYVYTRCVASDPADPRVAQTGTAKYFEWNFVPPAGGDRFYALNVWLPIGPTNVSPVGLTPIRVFTQRYFVYEITYGNNEKFVDVVDTDASGFGFIRLGNGGAPTNRVFPYSSGKPIKIRLYNTVPRDANGNLQLTPSTPTPNDVLVYADAAQAVPTTGYYSASSTSASYGSTVGFSVTAAKNELLSALRGGSLVNIEKGVVTSYEGNMNLWPVASVPQQRWRYSPLEESEFTASIDNPAASSTPGWTAQTIHTRHQGADYLDTLLIAPLNVGDAIPAPTQTVTYAPDLEDGSYEIYAYLPGDQGAERYGRSVQYRILEGTTETIGYVSQSTGGGWVRLGTRRYQNTKLTLPNLPLKVVFTNVSSDPVDVAQGRKSFADAVKFVGAASMAIKSTPVHATVKIKKSNGVSADTRVVIVADESGRIHCVDAIGSGDGTTTEYWSYPSTPDRSDDAWVDPNLTEGIDGTVDPAVTPARDNVPTALMPQRFDLSTATVARIGSQDFLYIGATNGRVYAIDMEGRGDYVATTRKVGSAKRAWTFPDDFPKIPALTNGVGAFRGSLVYGDVANGAVGPTVYVPASEGRIYALNAVGDSSTRTTTVRWQFPARTSPTLPPILMTPSLEFGRLYFGTLKNQNSDGIPGTFYALNASDGSVSWTFSGSRPADGVNDFADDFLCGPVTVPGARFDEVNTRGASASYPGAGLSPNPHPDVVYVLNQNRYLYGFVAQTGAFLKSTDNRIYRTNELGVVSDQNLGFTVITAYDRGTPRTLRPFPVVTVPTTEGHLYFMFGRAGDYNITSDATTTQRYAAGRIMEGSNVTSPAFSNKFLYVSDSEGYFKAYDNDPTNAGSATDSDGSDDETIPPNDPRGDIFRNLRIKLLNKTGYQELRRISTSNQGNLDYGTATTSSTVGYPAPLPGQPLAFEWGQTAYIMVYDFPYLTKNTANKDVQAPVVNISISVDGKAIRTVPVDTHQFKNPGTAPDVTNPAGTGLKQDGYAIIPFTFQNGGANSVPPGDGEIRAAILSAAVTNTTQPQEIAPDPRLRTQFKMANPLAIQMFDRFNNASASLLGIGVTNTASDLQNIVNGSPDIAGTPAYENQLLSSLGYVQHGNVGTSTVALYDRSLMALIRPEGRGIDNVRMERSNLTWQGGALSVFRGLSSTLYPRFEDLPDTYPNASLDYPDIGRENVSFTKDINGTAENPLLTNVWLLPPTNAAGATLTEDDDPNARRLRPTSLTISVNVPKYQPVPDQSKLTSLGVVDDVNNPLITRHDSAGGVQPQGYIGRARIFVDSTNDGRWNEESREAYRAFNISTAMVPDYKLQVSTPTINLGTLPTGAGYTPYAPGSTSASQTGSGAFNPWTGTNELKSMFVPFTVRNDGNVNFLNLRLAKGSTIGGNFPWNLGSPSNDDLAFLDGRFDLHSDLDQAAFFTPTNTFFAPPNPNDTTNHRVMLQKPRVVDRAPRELSVNPVRRANANLNVAGKLSDGRDDALNQTAGSGPSGLLYTPGAPRVAVTVPFGFPTGSYSETLRVIEDANGDQLWSPVGANSVEIYSDPTLKVSFNVGEARLTNSRTSKTATMVDDLLPAGTKNSYFNTQPAALRDAFGSLVVAWSSNRVGFNPAALTGPDQGNSSRIFLGTVGSDASFTATGVTTPVGTAPLRDLNYFRPDSAGRWFKQAVADYPTAPINTLFPGAAGETAVAGTEKFGSPAFPSRGFRDPLNPGVTFTGSYMAFTGEVEKSTPTGRMTESRVFLTPVSTNSSGALTVDSGGGPYSINEDPLVGKGKPSLVQTASSVLVFYGVTGAGQSGIKVARLRPAGNVFTNPVPLDFGTGFASVGNPSASARRYLGSDTSINSQLIDLAFTGRLKGRGNEEVYLGRVRLDTAPNETSDTTALQLVDKATADRRSIESGQAGSPFAYHPEQTNERLVLESNGTLRARGISWNPAAPLRLVQYLGGVEQVLTIPATRSVDRRTGQISYDSVLGGKVFFDPGLGTVRFSTGVPSKLAELRLTYTPAFLRITDGGTAGYTSPTIMFDDRYASDYTYRYRSNGNYANLADNLTNDRFVFTFGRSALAKDVARPYLTSFRLGVRLPGRVWTNPTSGATDVVVTPVGAATGAYQVDPVSGRVYFGSADEDKEVTVSYTRFDEATNQPETVKTTVRAKISFVLEKREEQIALEAVNETNLAAFLDPFTYQNPLNGDNRRPGLIWLFYTSTRGGAPDLYFQTIAPRFSPIIGGN